MKKERETFFLSLSVPSLQLSAIHCLQVWKISPLCLNSKRSSRVSGLVSFFENILYKLRSTILVSTDYMHRTKI